MRSVQIQDLKRRLSALVEEAERGASISITRHNRPVAVLGPAASANVHVGRNSDAAHLRPVGLTLSRGIAETLAEDRGEDR